MGRRLVCLILLWASVAQAQLPYVDETQDGTAGFDEMAWSSLRAYPSPCASNYAVRSIIEGSDQFDCAHIVDWPAGSPSDGMCIKFDAGTGGTRWEACGSGGGSPLVVLGPDYVSFDDSGTDKLIYYTGS